MSDDTVHAARLFTTQRIHNGGGFAVIEYHKLILWQIGTIILTVGTYLASCEFGRSPTAASALAVAVTIMIAVASSFVAMRDGTNTALTVCAALFVAFYGVGLVIFFLGIVKTMFPISVNTTFHVAGILILCAGIMIITGTVVSIEESIEPPAAITTGGVTLIGIVASLALGSATPSLVAVGLLGVLAFKTSW